MRRPESRVPILIVDDHPANLVAFEAVLQPLEEETVTATSGEGALKFLMERKCAVILMDVQMPGLDGFETARLINSRERNPKTPIIFITAINREEAHIVKGYASGAIDYVLKPVDPSVLRAKVKYFIDLYREREELEDRQRLIALQLERAQQRAEFLAEATVLLAGSLDYSVSLSKVASLAAERIADWCSITVIDQNETPRRVAIAHRDPTKQPLIERYRSNVPAQGLEIGELCTIAGSSKSVLLREVDDSQLELSAQSAEQLTLLRGLGLNSYIKAPMTAHQKSFGTLCLMRSDKTAPFGPADLAVAEELAKYAALAIDNAFLYETERKRADLEQHLIGIVSHDLRNPLSTILIAASSILQRAVDEPTRRAVARIKAATDKSHRMIRDLLDFTRARHGHVIQISVTILDFHRLTADVLNEIREIYPDRRIELAQRGSGEGEWDADRLSQVIHNLVSNALDYSPPDSEVQVRTEGHPDHVVLQIKNGGEPIPAERLAVIFQPLKPRSAKVNNNSHSIGLGLYIVEQIVLAHGGEVKAESSDANGTVFTVILPRPERATHRADPSGDAFVAPPRSGETRPG